MDQTPNRNRCCYQNCSDSFLSAGIIPAPFRSADRRRKTYRLRTGAFFRPLNAPEALLAQWLIGYQIAYLLLGHQLQPCFLSRTELHQFKLLKPVPPMLPEDIFLLRREN